MDMSLTGKTIAKLRKAAGFTQASLAEKLGISDKAVSKWERGIACPDVSLWNKLSILLDTDIESLIYGYDSKQQWKGLLVLDDRISPMIYVYDKPLIYYLISQFLLVGIRDITIIGECDALDLPGTNISILKNMSLLNHEFTSRVFIIYGNQFLYGANLTKHFQRAMSRTEGITIIASMKQKGKYPLKIDSDRKAHLSQKNNPNQYFAEQYVFIPKNSKNIDISSFEAVLKNNSINAETMARGMLSLNVCNYEEALRFSVLVKMIEEMTGEKIACVEEILIRRGISDFSEIKSICNKDTRCYLECLFSN